MNRHAFISIAFKFYRTFYNITPPTNNFWNFGNLAKYVIIIILALAIIESMGYDYYPDDDGDYDDGKGISFSLSLSLCSNLQFNFHN